MVKENYTPFYGKALMVILIALVDLFFTLYLKYFSNNINIYTFKLDYFGNILNISTVLFLLTTFAIFFSNKNIHFNRNIWITLLLSIAYIFPLLFLMYVYSFGFKFPGTYFLEYPIEKVSIAGLYIFNSMIKTFIIFLLWGMILNSGKILIIRSFMYLIFSILLLCLISFLYTYKNQTDYKANNSNLKYEIGVVLGAAVWQKNEPSTLFKGRIDKAKELYQNGKISKIQLTGSNAPGELSEAQTAFNYLTGLGVPPQAILIEEETRTTSEQIKFIKKELIDKNEFEEIIIISDNFHLARINEMSKFFRVKAVTVASDYSLNWEKLVYYRVRDSIGLLLFWLYAI